MRCLLPVLIGVLFSNFALAQTGKKQITLENLWKDNTFKVKSVPGFNAMKDGIHYTQIDVDGKHQSIGVYNLVSGTKEKVLFDNLLNKHKNDTLSIDNYEFSKDEQRLLLFTASENIYRRSVLNHVYVFDISTGTINLLENDKVLHATFSPNSDKVAYVKNNNIYIKNLTKKEVSQITFDGVKNKIINGNCDWVYEEEFAFSKAFDWSADGNFLAYYRFDESAVAEYTMAKYTGLYPEQYTYKYPKAGEKNSIVTIKMYDLQNKKTVNADIGAETDQYIPRIKWTESSTELCIYRLNRLQNKLELLLTNSMTGISSVIYKDENKYFVNIDDEITFLPSSNSFVIRSERDSYNHLYLWDWKENKLNDLTKGSFDVDAMVGIDVDKKLLYYTSAEISPLQRNLYVVELSGKNKKCLTPETGFHSITPCEGYKYFLDKFSTLNKAPVYTLIDNKGKKIRVLEDNHELNETMAGYNLGKIQFMTIKGATENLNGWLITPPDFDSTKKYPVLLYQYSGPGSQEVADRFPVGNYFWHQMLAEHGYLVFCADGIGTGFRGEAFMKKTYLQLGKYESEDQIAVAKNLGNLPFVDKNRMGIWGWSFGGFMSSNCILKGNDVFKMAIAVAPVTNWRYYDNIYTERYMRTPAENAKGYDENAPDKIADRLKGKFLYIHGTADDNVHFQNSVMLTTSLIKAGKDFDSEYYPDKAHGISGGAYRLHLYRRMTDFIYTNL